MDSFWAKVDKTEGCWNWLGHIAKDGYAKHYYDGSNKLAHRLSFMFSGGKLQSGMEIDHLCRNRSCVNPDHLEQVTPRTNTLRSHNMAAKHAVRTHCNKGHEFTEENTYVRTDGGRRCRTCLRHKWLMQKQQCSTISLRRVTL